MRLEIYPVFSFHLQFDEFYAVDLVSGYYQIRFRFKSLATLEYSMTCETTSTSCEMRPYVFGNTGISRTLRILAREQLVEVGDVFKCQVTLHKRLDKFDTLDVPLQLELWYVDPDSFPCLDKCTMVSHRIVHTELRVDKSLHSCRPVFFEYFSFSAVSLCVHASVTSVLVNRTKAIPDPPLNEKLRTYHRVVCQKLASCLLSLQSFIFRYRSILSSPLNIDHIDVTALVKEKQAALESSADPWTELRIQVDEISSQLSNTFVQLFQLFSTSGELRDTMHEEFDLMRVKSLSQAFLYVEDTVQRLLNPVPNYSPRIFDLMRSCSFLAQMPNLPVRTLATDVDPLTVTMIVEHRFLPTSVDAAECLAEAASAVEPFASPVPEIVGDCDSRRRSLRNGANERLLGLCLPLKYNSQMDDDSYGVKDNFLRVNSDRLSQRRMTDPGAGIRIESVKLQTPELKTLFPVVSDAWHKSHSVVNVVNAAVPCNGDATTSSTSSSESIEIKKDGRNKQQNDLPDGSHLAIDQKLLCYIHAKEQFKERLHNVGFRGYVYSDLARVSGRRPLFSNATASAVDSRGSSKLHLIVFVHGLEGTAEDLAVYRNYLRVAMPDANLEFLLSEANQTETWSDLGRLAKNLVEEVLAHIQRMPRPPEMISMVAHSMGGLIVRAACALDGMKPWVPKLHTLLTLNSPHCGLMYNQRAANWGITLLQWWKQSAAIGQLTLKDSVQFQDCFLYKLSKNNVFGYFRYVLLVGSYNDLYVPGHSALVDQCKAASSDPSAQGTIYSEIVANINESIATSPKRTTLVKYTVSHPLGNVPRSQQVMGRAAHIAAVDDESFIDTLISVSVEKYFR